jgi:soluble lytic murein transglycosylase
MLPQESLDFVAAFARKADDLHASHRVLLRRGWFDQHPEEGGVRRWQLAFPVAYRELVERYAALRGIDPFLILAIMRHESGFNARAVSGANAAGLIQVILPTAKMTARWMGERPPRRIAEMFEPDRNIRIGTRYLQHVLGTVDGNAALAVAGYNAGAGAIRVWRDRWGHLDTDEFVEELPYREAHGYTKQVMQSWGAYRYLYAPRGADEARRIVLPIRAKPAQQAEIGPVAGPSHSLTPQGAGPTFGRAWPTSLHATE